MRVPARPTSAVMVLIGISVSPSEDVASCAGAAGAGADGALFFGVEPEESGVEVFPLPQSVDVEPDAPDLMARYFLCAAWRIVGHWAMVYLPGQAVK